MQHSAPLITTLAAALGLALVMGFIAARLKLPALAGYLLAGIVIGPATPGFVADLAIASQLAEIGVMLLMFGVGLHFSVEDLLAVRKLAVPGAIAQMAVAAALGIALARWWGWTLGAALVFGLALSVASTVVLTRALESRGLLDSLNGRIAVGWLVVQDLAMVLVLVLLPPLSGWLGGTGASDPQRMAIALGRTVLEVGVFVALMWIVGRRLFPWLLWQVTKTGSRELFTLCVVAAAVTLAYGSAALFGVSFALGAFFAGMVLRESRFSQRAAQESLPLRDAFAVLFFVSVGMLFDPQVLVDRPLEVLAVVAIIVLGSPLTTALLMLLFGYPLNSALTVAAGLAQIGEFSFILVGLGVTLGLLPTEGRDLVLAGALLSITLNPLAFAGIQPIVAWLNRRPRLHARIDASMRPQLIAAPGKSNGLRGHAVLIGYGRVGGAIGPVLTQHGFPLVVIERDRRVVDDLRAKGVPIVYGDASASGVLAAAGVAFARLLVVTTPDGFQARRILEVARAANATIDIVVRTHSYSELEHLQRERVGHVVMGEREIAMSMLEYSLRSLGVPKDRARMVISEERGAQVSSEGT
jgi:monovalent cation:H+ antiporter-2, CPA2 family